MKLSTETDRTRYIAFLQAQALPLDVQCEPWRAPRTNEANAYLWRAVYQPLVERCGFTKDEWHEFMCMERWGAVEILKPSGAVEYRPKRTTTRNEHGKRDVLKGKAFADFVTFVESECAKRGVFVAEQWEDKAA